MMAASQQNGHGNGNNPMDDPVEQAHFRKIVAAFFFYQVSFRLHLEDWKISFNIDRDTEGHRSDGTRFRHDASLAAQNAVI